MSLSCWSKGCDRRFNGRQGRTYHMSVSHNLEEMAIERLSELDEKPDYDNCSERVGISSRYYETHFGSWNRALKLADFEPTLERNVSDKDLINALVEFSEAHDPRYEMMNEKGPYSARVYELRFGSWDNALLEADIDPFEQTGEDNPAWTDADEIARGTEWRRLSYEIKDRRGWKCEYCGEEEFDVHTHHNEPVGMGGDLIDNTFTVLCKECHLGNYNKWHPSQLEEYIRNT